MDFRSLNFDLAENIFFFHNLETVPLIFVLYSDTEDNFYFNLLNRFFAEVIDKPNKNSLVLAQPENSTYFHNYIPAFNIKYIEDCFKFKDYPDPTKYLIKNSCPLNYTKDNIFDCWFHKKKIWSDYINSSIDPLAVNLRVSNEKRTRFPYTHKEDTEIVKYILKNNYAFDVYGRKMWQIMEHTNLGKIRTWQSLKERYIKNIRNELVSGNIKFSFLTPKDLKLLRQGLKIDTIKDHEKKTMKLKLQSHRNEDWVDDESS